MGESRSSFRRATRGSSRRTATSSTAALCASSPAEADRSGRTPSTERAPADRPEMGTAPAVPHLARETTEAAGPGRWVNCGVDPMRAPVFWPNTPRAKPFSRKTSLFARKFVSTRLTTGTDPGSKPTVEPDRLLVAQEARHVEHVLRALEPFFARRDRLLAQDRRRRLRTPASPAVAAEPCRDHRHGDLVALRVVDDGAEDD